MNWQRDLDRTIAVLLRPARRPHRRSGRGVVTAHVGPCASGCYRCDLRADEALLRSPDCDVAKHTACSGDAWDHEADLPARCACGCHK